MPSRALPSLLLAAALSALAASAQADDGKAASSPGLSLLPADAPLPATRLADDPVDFDALRIAYGRRLDFHQRCELAEPRKAWNAAMQENNPASAYALMLAFLEQCPVSEPGHLGAMTSANALNDPVRAALHRRWFLGLTDSVLRSGDGKTARTAWVTISVSEEYATLMRLGRKPVQQALLTERVDRMTTVPATGDGETVDLFFKPELHFARLLHDLHPKE